MQIKSLGLMLQLLGSVESLDSIGYMLVACEFLKQDAFDEWMNEVAMLYNDADNLAT